MVCMFTLFTPFSLCSNPFTWLKPFNISLRLKLCGFKIKYFWPKFALQHSLHFLPEMHFLVVILIITSGVVVWPHRLVFPHRTAMTCVSPCVQIPKILQSGGAGRFGGDTEGREEKRDRGAESETQSCGSSTRTRWFATQCWDTLLPSPWRRLTEGDVGHRWRGITNWWHRFN